MTPVRDLDVVVIGGGVLGLATTDALLRAGADAVCLESGAPGGRQSSGQTRIFRYAYRRPEWIEFARTARTGWDAWGARRGEPLIESTGSLLVTTDPETDTAGLQATGVPFEILTENRQANELPWRRPTPGATVVLETTAGTIRAHDTIQTLCEWIGGHLERAVALDARPLDGGGALVRCMHGVLRAKAVIICAGVELPRFAESLDLAVPLTSHPHTRGVFRLKDPVLDAMRFPSFRDKTAHPRGAVYSYSIPLSAHEVAVGIEPADNAGTFDPLQTMADTIAWVRESLPGLDPEPVRLESCDSTALAATGPGPWESEGMGIWQRGDISMFAGGHYFKFAPALGEVLADIALGADVPMLFAPPDNHG